MQKAMQKTMELHNRIWILFLTGVLLTFSLMICAAGTVKAESAEADGKTLVVYYSATGHTETVANEIAETLNADLFQLIPTEPYSDADLDWTDENSRVCYEHDHPEDRAVELEETAVDGWESYSTVFIGYPIWWGNASWVLDGFIAANDFTGKTIIPFFSHNGSSNGANSLSRVAELSAGATVLTDDALSIRGSSVAGSEKEVKQWAADFVTDNSDSAETTNIE